MIDHTGTFVRDLRDAAANWPSPLTDYTIRPAELDPEDIPADGKSPRAIVVLRLHPLRLRRLPMATYPFRVRCYHPDARIASQLAGLVSDTFHDRGPKVSAARVGSWNAADVGGSGTLIEPDTRYPFEDVLLEVIGATSAIP